MVFDSPLVGSWPRRLYLFLLYVYAVICQIFNLGFIFLVKFLVRLGILEVKSIQKSVHLSRMHHTFLEMIITFKNEVLCGHSG